MRSQRYGYLNTIFSLRRFYIDCDACALKNGRHRYWTAKLSLFFEISNAQLVYFFSRHAIALFLMKW